MKILYVTTIGSTMCFFGEHFKRLSEEGHSVDLACNDTTDVPEIVHDLQLKVYPISFSRSPLSKDNIKACEQLKNLIKTEKYDIVHCHTPNAAVVTRFACRSLRKKD